MRRPPLPCPICGGAARAIPVRRFTAREVAQRFVRREVDPERHERLRRHVCDLWRGEESELLDCGRCGFGYANPFVAGDALFYELSSDNTNYPAWKWEFQKTLDTLQTSRIASGRVGRLLEVGAGDGAMLRALAAAGWPKEAMLGLEYSGSGLRAMRASGFECQPIDVRDLEADGPFEVVCMFQVLEHLDGLDAFFAKLRSITAPGGDLFIAVPNGEWQRDNESLGTVDDYPPNHISRWKRDNFELLTSRFGWILRGFELEPVDRLTAARFAFSELFFRKSEQAGSLANAFVRVASHVPGRAPERAVKALGATLQPDCWRVAAKRLLFSSPPPNAWVHLSCPA